MDRRRFLTRTSAAAAGLVLTAGCAPGRLSRPEPLPPASRFGITPVRVSHERVVRTIAGLRPYRAAGYVVRVDRYDDRPVIHNYGHGGGGITLAWGSSLEAVELAMETGHRAFAVLGCGVMGLTTARLLLDRGCTVTIYARELSPHTTSNVAGGQWSPASVSSSSATTEDFERRLERALRRSNARFQTLVGPRYGVRWIDNYSLRTSPPPALGGPIADLFADEVRLGPGEHPFPTPWVTRYTTLIIEPNTFLPALEDDVLLRGGRIRKREFHGLEEVLALDEPAIMNCTGLGARDLFGDEDLTPIKGQLAVLLPQPEVDYITLSGGSYMFPRSDGIVLGGSHERGEWSLDNTPEVIDRIVSGNAAVFDAMRP